MLFCLFVFFLCLIKISNISKRVMTWRKPPYSSSGKKTLTNHQFYFIYSHISFHTFSGYFEAYFMVHSNKPYNRIQNWKHTTFWKSNTQNLGGITTFVLLQSFQSQYCEETRTKVMYRYRLYLLSSVSFD